MGDVALSFIIIVDDWNRSSGAEVKFNLDKIVKSLELFHSETKFKSIRV